MSRESKLLGALAIGATGFAAYKFLYLPTVARKQAQGKALAQAIQAKHPGASFDSIVKDIGTKGCQAAGLYYGIPPNLSGQLCKIASASVVSGTRASIKGTGTMFKTIGTANVDLVKGTVVKPVQGAYKSAKKFLSSIF